MRCTIVGPTSEGPGGGIATPAISRAIVSFDIDTDGGAPAAVQVPPSGPHRA